MNAKQAAKAAAKKIEELEDYNRRASSDIKAYNEVILGMIDGKSPCDWCEENNACGLQAKADGKGCQDWWLMWDHPETPAPDGSAEGGDDSDDSKGILSASPDGGE